MLQEIEQQCRHPSASSFWAVSVDRPLEPADLLELTDWQESVQTHLDDVLIAFIARDGSEFEFDESDLRDKLYCFTENRVLDHRLFTKKSERTKFLSEFISQLPAYCIDRIADNRAELKNVKLEDTKQKLDEMRETPETTTSDIVALGHVNAEAIELLRAVFPYVEWDKEVRGLGDTRLQQQLDAAAATIISDCYEPASRFIRELSFWRRVDEHDLKTARELAAKVTEAVTRLSMDHGYQMRENPEYYAWLLSPEKQGDPPSQMAKVRVDFDEDADVLASNDWRYCFSYWVGCYVYDYKRFPPAHRIASFKRFAHTFGALMTIKVLDRIYENENMLANPEIFPRVALQWSKGAIFPIVECKTKDWVNETRRSPVFEKFTFRQVDSVWDEMQKNLLAMFEKGELSM